MKCVSVAKFKSREVFFDRSTLRNQYCCPRFPRGWVQIFFRHWIPWSRNVENCIFDSVRALKFLYCFFVIHKLEKEISPIIRLQIFYDPWSLGCIRTSRLEESKEQKYIPTTGQIDESWCEIIMYGMNMLSFKKRYFTEEKKSGKANT